MQKSKLEVTFATWDLLPIWELEVITEDFLVWKHICMYRRDLYLFQTLELTESLNNLLDGKNNQVESVSCDNVHCCQKTIEMVQENPEESLKTECNFFLISHFCFFEGIFRIL